MILGTFTRASNDALTWSLSAAFKDTVTLQTGKPPAPIPVRVPGRIVAIRAGEASIASVVQIAEPPRAKDPGGAGNIKAGAFRAITPNLLLI